MLEVTGSTLEQGPDYQRNNHIELQVVMFENMKLTT